MQQLCGNIYLIIVCDETPHFLSISLINSPSLSLSFSNFFVFQADDDADESVAEPSRNVAAVDNVVLDLDTRLKLLMKDKTGAMPAFLLQELNSGSDNESEKEAEKSPNKKSVEQIGKLEEDEEEDDSPLSRPPSPFLSDEHYFANLLNRTKKNSETRNAKSARPQSQNSDRMSLSR